MNQPHAAPVHNYSQDGSQRHQFNEVGVPIYAPNSFGGPVADPARGQDGAWESDGELVRTAATLHSEDSDFGQPGTLYREVYDDGAKARLLETLTGQGQSITIDEIRERFFQYWTNVDGELGAKLRAAVAV